jgi:hypothetical protein
MLCRVRRRRKLCGGELVLATSMIAVAARPLLMISIRARLLLSDEQP